MPNTAAPELKAGHPPADKAGAMRITQHKTEKSLAGSPPIPQTNIELALSNSVAQQRALRTDVHGKAEMEPPAEALKAFHDSKPQPTHEYRSNHPTKPMAIQQPRKQ